MSIQYTPRDLQLLAVARWQKAVELRELGDHDVAAQMERFAIKSDLLAGVIVWQETDEVKLPSENTYIHPPHLSMQ